MAIIVQKYGGSSVGDIEKIKRVAQKVVATRAAGYDVVVVVSAMGNSTDDLLALARQITLTPDRRELDMLLSVGERISMSLLSMGIQALGHEAISFTGSQSGIITTASHANARIIEVRPFRIQDELDRGRVVIIAGYQGTSYKREVTTLGRGGSDMTAVALAGALGAEACEIYSDVDGIYSSDPRVVWDAARLESITADEVLEMARHGAKVLHDEAVAYAKRVGIALYARSTHDPESKGTVVRPDGWPDEALARVAIRPRAVAAHHQVLVARTRDVDAVLAFVGEGAQGANVLCGHTLGDGESVMVLDATNCDNVEETGARLAATLGDDATVDTTSTNVTLVGQDIGRGGRWQAEVRRVLRDAGVDVREVFVQQHAIVVLVPHAQREATMRACHSLVPAS